MRERRGRQAFRAQEQARKDVEGPIVATGRCSVRRAGRRERSTALQRQGARGCQRRRHSVGRDPNKTIQKKGRRGGGLVDWKGCPDRFLSTTKVPEGYGWSSTISVTAAEQRPRPRSQGSVCSLETKKQQTTEVCRVVSAAENRTPSPSRGTVRPVPSGPTDCLTA